MWDLISQVQLLPVVLRRLHPVSPPSRLALLCGNQFGAPRLSWRALLTSIYSPMLAYITCDLLWTCERIPCVDTCTVDVAMPENKPSSTTVRRLPILLPNTLLKTTLDSAKASLWTLTTWTTPPLVLPSLSIQPATGCYRISPWCKDCRFKEVTGCEVFMNLLIVGDLHTFNHFLITFLIKYLFRCY